MGLPVGFDPTTSRLRGGCSASLSYRSLRPIPPEGFEPSRARGPRRSERRAYAFRHGGKHSGSGGNRAEGGRRPTRVALGFNQPLYR